MREDGLGSDAGRQSLTEVGAVAARAASGTTCRRCGIGCAPGATLCANCGAIQRLASTETDSRANAPGPLPPVPLPAREAAAADPIHAGPPPVQATRAPGAPAEARAAPAGRPAARGERLVGWSALGVLLVAAVYFVQRIGSLHGEAAEVPPASVERAALVTPERPAPDASAGPRQGASSSSPAEALDVPSTAGKRSAAAPSRARPKSPARSQSRATAPSRAVAPAVQSRPAPAEVSPPSQPVVVAVGFADVPRTRWESMRDEIAMCSVGGFFEGVLCEQRVRVHYCDGWWGQASECPSGRQGDYGN
jgi:hypothetical protein